MTTLIVRIEDGAETKNIAAAVRQLKGVATVKIQQDQAVTKSVWEQAVTDGAVSVDAFFNDLNARIEKWPE